MYFLCPLSGKFKMFQVAASSGSGSELCTLQHRSYFSQDVGVRSAHASRVSRFLPHVEHETSEVAASRASIYPAVMHMKLSVSGPDGRNSCRFDV